MQNSLYHFFDFLELKFLKLRQYIVNYIMLSKIFILDFEK
jgi:hypothetical protein